MNIFNLFTISWNKKKTKTLKYGRVININYEREVIGRYIKKFRIKRELSQCELSEITDISSSALSRLERGLVRLTERMSRKLSKALNIDLNKKQREIKKV